MYTAHRKQETGSYVAVDQENATIQDPLSASHVNEQNISIIVCCLER